MLVLPLRLLRLLKASSLVELVKESVSGALLCFFGALFPVVVGERGVSLLCSLDTDGIIYNAPLVSPSVLNRRVAVAYVVALTSLGMDVSVLLLNLIHHVLVVILKVN